ncbi:MAG: hypothetical protein ABMA13_18925 [Chthoniobacteraceae bacterium]
MPKATAVFDADDSRLSGALARINGKMLALQSRIAKFAVAFIAIRAAAGVVTAGFDRFKQALDVGGQLNDLSANTGIAVADLVVLQQEFANAGKSAEDIGPVFGKMAKTLQGGSADDTIKKLGINLEELKKKTPAEQFRTLGAAINTIQDPSQKAAASMEIFGRSGAELLSLFSSDGFGDAASQVGSQAQILAKDAALFDDVGDKLALTGLKVRGFWVGVAEKVAPVLKPLLDKFASLDLASWGQKAGEAVAFIVQAFADGKVGDILFTSAKIAFANAVNFLAGTLMAVAQALWQALVESVKNAITLFEIVTTADFWIGMGKSLMGIAQGFIAFLLDGIAKLLDYLSGIPLIGEKIGAGAKEMQGWADTVRQSGQENRDAGGDLLAPAFDKAAARMQEAFSNIGNAMSEGFDKGSSLIDTSDWQEHLDDAIGGVMDHAQVVSQQSRDAVEPKQSNGPMIEPEEGGSKKPAISAIQRIGGGGNAYGSGDPMLREQQRQTKELNTQTGLLRDVKRLLDRSPSPKATLTPVFG